MEIGKHKQNKSRAVKVDSDECIYLHVPLEHIFDIYVS